jgi:microcystin degradation protein MlrC
MYAAADAMLKREGVLSNSVVLGFPYADVEEMGSGFVVVTDHDKSLAQRLADELGRYLVEHREEFRGKFISIEDAVADAVRSDGPVLLLDMGDNVGGGGPGDATHLAHGVRAGNPKRRKSFVALYDPAAVRACDQAGPRKRVRLSMGGHTDSLHGKPIDAEVTVRSLHAGKFTEPQVRHSGITEFDMGRTAIVETDDGMTIQLTTNRVFPISLIQLTSCGLDPASFHILTAKGVQAPVAAYQQVCKKIIRANTPGSTSADMSHFTYHYRRRPLFPFENV